MNSIVFLGINEIIQTHDYQIKRFGGHTGIRDIGLLQSAVAMPTVSFGGEYLHSNIYEMAAAYLFHIIKNHPFIDGNKRTGAVSALVFLQLNGLRVNVARGNIEKLAIAVAEGNMDKTVISLFFRNNSVPLAE